MSFLGDFLNKSVGDFLDGVEEQFDKKIDAADRFTDKLFFGDTEEADSASSSLGAKYGDVIGVRRFGYEHYGVYESDGCIYEYNGKDDVTTEIRIRTTTLSHFVGSSDGYFVLDFPKLHITPAKRDVPYSRTSGVVSPHIGELLDEIIAQANYHLYSPEETIRRARSRVGEKKYNLVLNNCEHFAIWCKTGLNESHQINSILKQMERRRVW